MNGTQHTRDAIYNRILKDTAWMWDQTNVDGFDPVVNLLTGACATELEMIYQAVKDSDARISQRLAELLIPDVLTGPMPAHAVLHARATRPAEYVKPQNQFYMNAQKSEQRLPDDVFFAPVFPFKLLNGQMRFLANGRRIYEMKEVYKKKEIAATSEQKSLPSYEIWIGIDLDDKVTALDDVSFFFDWPRLKEKYRLYKALSLTKWYLGAEELTKTIGLPKVTLPDETNEKATLNTVLKDDFDVVKRTRNRITGFYDSSFITLKNILQNSEGDEDRVLQQLKKPYPDAFKTLFADAHLKQFKEDLLWIKVVFPQVFSQEAMREAHCYINSFPVMNSRICEVRPQRMERGVSTIKIPLEDNEFFLGVETVENADSEQYRRSQLTFERESSKTYSVRWGGIEKFDTRDAAEMLSYLIELLRDESAAFALLQRRGLSMEVKQLRQTINRLEKERQEVVSDTGRSPYLRIHVENHIENIYTTFWTTNGEFANKISSGSALEIYNAGDIARNSLVLLTRPGSGKEPPNAEQNIHAYRNAVMTRNRLVTKEDIRSFCFLELGDNIADVVIKKGIQPDMNRTKGYLRTLDVVLITSEDTITTTEEWERICHDMKNELERRSTGFYPFRVLAQLNVY